MTDQTTETSTTESGAAAEEAQVWYVAEAVGTGGLLAFLGKTLTTAKGAAPPTNSSPWKPHDSADGMLRYLVNGVWVQGRDFRSFSVDDLKSAALEASRARLERATVADAGDYSNAERATWSQQRAEAAAFAADPKAPTPMLSALAAARGIPVDALASSVATKAATYALNTAKALGTHQVERAKIADAKVAADVQAFTPDDLMYGIL
jgi:hypothetical protein